MFKHFFSVFLFVFFIFPISANASCWDDCSLKCAGATWEVDPGTCTSRCAASCPADNGGGGGGGQHVPQYGAIAVSTDTLEYGVSYNYGSRREAEQAAMEYCGHKDCEIGTWFYDTCAAIAMKPESKKGARDGAWGTDWGGSKKSAGKKAVKACATEGCTVVEAFCSL